ncbi:MAG: DUF169 domain-containing protein [Candidatus Pacearchaeota archaeon]
MGKNLNFEDLHNRYNSLVRGKGVPVGIKFLKKKDELKKIGVMPLEDNLALCQVMKLAAVYEKTRGVYFENIDACVVGTYILGFGMPPADIKERWVKGFAYNPNTFDKLVKNIEALPQKKFEAAIFGPLKEFQRLKQEPDAIVMFVNSSQSYLLMVSYFDATGKKPCSCINGHAACEVISAVAMGKSPWLTIPCGGARSVGDAQDDEIWIGMKPEELDTALKRLEQTGFKYPPAVNQMVMSPLNPKHPLTDLIARESISKK